MGKLKGKQYEKLLEPLQIGLISMAQWAKVTGARVLVLFEGRDAAGKSGVINAITAPLNSRQCRTVALAKPSENEPVRRYSSVEPRLFQLIRDRCVEPGKMCMHDMMAIDARGGLGLAGINLLQPADGKGSPVRSALFGPKSTTVTGYCTTEEALAAVVRSPTLL